MELLQLQILLAVFLPISYAYTIEDCGNGKPAIEYAITLAQTSMIQPLLDIRVGVSSTYGYTAMYKSNIFIPFLQGLMNNILHLAVIQAGGRDQEPTIICVQPGMGQKYDIGYDPLERCAQTGAESFWAKDTAFVFLCASFTALKFQPVFSPDGPRDIYCPLVQNNVFVGQSDPLVKYQSYELVHQLAHLYLQDAGLTSETEPKEVTDWNSCVGLGWTPFDGGVSVKNPFNLVYYAACEYLLVHTRVYGKLIGDSRQSAMHTDAGSVCATILGAG